MKKCISCSKKKLILIDCKCKTGICLSCVSSHICDFNFKESFKESQKKIVEDVVEIVKNKKVCKI